MTPTTYLPPEIRYQPPVQTGATRFFVLTSCSPAVEHNENEHSTCDYLARLFNLFADVHLQSALSFLRLGLTNQNFQNSGIIIIPNGKI